MEDYRSHQSDHLQEFTLHEYIDGALDPAVAGQVEAHLAGCRACQAEFEALQALFLDLKALPDVPLARDLSSLVVDSIHPYTIPWQTGRWLVLVQVVIALAVLAFSWPLVARLAAGFAFEAYTVQAQAWLTGTLEALAGSLAARSIQADALLDQVVAFFREPPGISAGGVNIWPWVAAIGMFWLLVNGAILGPDRLGKRFNASNGNP